MSLMTGVTLNDGGLLSPETRWANVWILTAVLSAFFWVLELRHHYYFLQDDNRVAFLGALAHNWRALTEGGLALFNFHQFLGLPFMAPGQSATLYPPSYMAVGLSKLVFGHIFAAVDIYIILHLLAGGAAMFYFLDKAGTGRRAAFLGGLAWPLNGFAVYMSANWFFVCPLVAYFPLMLALASRTLQNAGSAFALAAARLGLFYTGYPQYFVHAALLEILYIASIPLFGGKKPDKAALRKYMASHILTGALALPLLLPMWHLVRISADRSGPLPYFEFASEPNNLLLWLQGLVWPVRAEWMYHDGFFARLFRPEALRGLLLPCYATVGWVMVFFAVWLLATRRFREWSAQGKAAAVLFVVALAWSFGLFNRLLYLVPVMNRFRVNFKLVLFVNFALTALGAAGYAAFELKRVHRTALFAVSLALSIAGFAFIYLMLPPRDFTGFTEIPPLTPPISGPDISGRIVAVTPCRTDVTRGMVITRRDDLRLAAFDYATLWGYHCFAGYQVLVPRLNAEMTFGLNDSAVLPLDIREFTTVLPYLRGWGVRRYIIKNSSLPFYEKFLAASGIRREQGDSEYAIFNDSLARPMVYPAGAGGSVELYHSFSVNGVSISKKSGPPVAAVVNALYNPFFKAVVNGKTAQIAPTANGQIMIELPPGQADARVYYRDPWFELGLVLSGLTVAVCIVIPLIRRRNRAAAA